MGTSSFEVQEAGYELLLLKATFKITQYENLVGRVERAQKLRMRCLYARVAEGEYGEQMVCTN